MISRRKILSKSRDDINLLSNGHLDDSEDVWYQKETLFKDHIQEVLNKWNQIDDEIWAKVVILERNRRVAKAYARAPVLTINGSDVGFDGFKIGLLGFDNPLRDKRTHECRRHIGYGIKIKMDENGNILIKRQSRASVFVKHTTLDEESAISNDIFKLPQGALEPNKPFILFDMKKFQVNVTKELKKAYPNRRKLENQCLCAVAFVKSDNELLKCPIWMLIINMVAIDMLKSQIPMDHLPGLPATTDEENYSICRTVRSYQDNQLASHISSSSSNGSCKKEPPELPPRKTLMDEMSSETPPPSSICRIPSKKHKNKVKKLKKQPGKIKNPI
ncbi:hypothetical protein ABEB36_012352 [Hypothenemus hampei]|uniref:MH2 domain-containing protein n=1 Tax=Hypothenemus hampei TaxID=57062 RepID=A0ABD1EAW7_HYPHA